MLKPKIDINETIGNDYILIDKDDWLDYNDSRKILGTKLYCGAVQKFEKFTVKVAKNNINIENGEKIQFINLKATPYSDGKYVNISFKADDVQKINEEKNLFK